MTFGLVNTPLSQGVTRLEASAGTGKTFALAGLFLRLVLEENIPASEILVVTFTEAATAELRDRIRRRLMEALGVLEAKPTSDELLLALAKRVQPRLGSAVTSLRNALETFDLVSIYTIHGFCQRTLQDNAFESGLLFDAELVTDQDSLIREIAADYFRREIQRSDPVLASAAFHKDLTPEVLARMLKRYLTYPELRLNPAAPPRPVEQVAQELRDAFANCAGVWSRIARAPELLVSYFVGGKKWATGDHARRVPIEVEMAKLEACLDPANLSTRIWEAIEFFALSAIREKTGKGKQMPEPPTPLFGHCESLLALASEYALAHRLLFLKAAGKALENRKQQAKQQSFDDLVTRLAGALDGPSGPALARSARRKYRVALIDEAQDTDPLQWRIFQRIFAGSPDHWLYLIGDPKQAIYGFRGADVHTYLHAAATAQQEYSLDTNWRSEAALVNAVNALFSGTGTRTAFVEEAIAFDPVKPGGKVDQDPLVFSPGGHRPPPFQVWCWEPDDRPATAKQARKELPVSVAAEISRLLRGGHQLGGRELQPRDIAVLVESHRQAGWVQSALHDLRIPSVEQAMASVFASREARELQWILAAILAPGRESPVKSALTTDTLGLSGSRLQELAAVETEWQVRLQRFAQYREWWERDGFFFMFARLLREEKIIENLLRFADGERRITNLLHVAELLEAGSQAQHLGPSRLVQWLAEQRVSDETALEHYQLRLESDEDAVQIITIHRSKGLQYPIVFCPFVSKDARLGQIRDGSRKILEVVLYHDPATNALTWDLSPDASDAHRQQAAREQLGEKVRLLYVALTRACHRCYLVSARYARNKATALAWLFYPHEDAVADPVAALDAQSVTPGAWKNRWRAIADAAANGLNNPAIAVDELPTGPGEPWQPERADSGQLAARSCRREIKPGWFLSSFTQLSNGLSLRRALEGDLPDHDEAVVEPRPPGAEDQAAEVPCGIFALPPGARTGDCLHLILEQFDFAGDDSASSEALVNQQLAAYGLFEEAHVRAVHDMLERLRLVPLDPENPDFTLSRVSRAQRLTEFEFHFPAHHLDGPRLLDFIRDAALASAAPAVARPPAGRPRIDGFLKGFIDLIFLFEGRYYIVDWKSNRLGNRIEDYSQEAMQRAITESCYDLQYHLYTVALDKYLRVRLPEYDYEEHFGGVRYIFLRGVAPERPDLGIYRDRPSAQAITRLSSLLGTFAEVKL